MKSQEISLSEIEQGDRARKQYGDLAELSQSIRESGVVVPIGVMTTKGNEDKVETDKKYILLHGGRRVRAAIEAELTVIPALIFDRKVDKAEAWNIELIENLHRKDMTWPEEIALKRKIHAGYIERYGQKTSTAQDAEGWSRAQTAKALGVSPQQLGSDLVLAEAIESIPDLTTLGSKADAHKVISASIETIERRQIVKEIEKEKAETPTAKYKKELSSRYMIGEVNPDPLLSGFFKGVKEIPDNSIDLVEIDPPYGIDLTKVKKDQSGTASAMTGYNEIDALIYTPFLDKVMKESFRVLKQGGWCILWFGPEPWFEPSYLSLKKAGFSVRRIPGLWLKGRGQTLAPNIYLANSYEFFHYARKGDATIVSKGRTNTFDFSPVNPSKKVHQTERPIELMETILLTFAEPGSRIMVPFLGSGNTILAADNINMTAFGWDLTKDYKNEFVLRVEGKQSREGKFRSY